MDQHTHHDPSRTGRPVPSDADPILSDADAVEKTTWVADVHGADTEANGQRGVEVTAAVHADSASPIAWIGAVLAVLALAAYGAAMFS